MKLIAISEGRENSIAKSVHEILLSDCLLSARDLASIVGRIISGRAVLAIFPDSWRGIAQFQLPQPRIGIPSFILINIVLGNCMCGNLKRPNCRVVTDSPYRMPDCRLVVLSCQPSFETCSRNISNFVPRKPTLKHFKTYLAMAMSLNKA